MPVVKGEQDQPEAEQVQICPEELPEAAADPGDLLLFGRLVDRSFLAIASAAEPDFHRGIR